MFLRYTSLLLLALLVYSEARLLVIHVDYVLNLEEIKAEKCVEKEIPESTCHGKCFVRKQILLVDDQNEKEAPALPSELETERIPMITNEEISWELDALTKPSKNHLFRYQNLLSEVNFEIEAPPPQC